MGIEGARGCRDGGGGIGRGAGGGRGTGRVKAQSASAHSTPIKLRAQTKIMGLESA